MAPLPGDDIETASAASVSVSGAEMAKMRTIPEINDPDSGTETMPESDSDQELDTAGEIVEGIIGGMMMNVSFFFVFGNEYFFALNWSDKIMLKRTYMQAIQLTSVNN